MLSNTLSVLAVAISITTLLFARRGYLRETARLRTLEARYPHFTDRTDGK